MMLGFLYRFNGVLNVFLIAQFRPDSVRAHGLARLYH